MRVAKLHGSDSSHGVRSNLDLHLSLLFPSGLRVNAVGIAVDWVTQVEVLAFSAQCTVRLQLDPTPRIELGCRGTTPRKGHVPFLCLTFDHLSRRMFEVATCG